MFKRPWISTVGVGLVAGLFVLASCGGSESSSGTVPSDADLTVTAVEGIVWDAKSYTATATDGAVTIAVKNDSSLPHNFYVIDATGVENPTSIDIPRRGSIESKSFTLAAGSYTMICKVPGHGNMKATLVIS